MWRVFSYVLIQVFNLRVEFQLPSSSSRVVEASATCPCSQT